MREWHDRKSLVVPLGVLAVTVWAYVLYTLVAAWPASEPDVQVPSLQAPDVTETIAHVWQDDFRDPFSSTVRSEPPVSRVPRNVSATPEVVVRLRLIGVVDGTAMLEQPDGGVLLARRGTDVEGGQVTSVSPEAVVLRIRGRTQTLRLE